MRHYYWGSAAVLVLLTQLLFPGKALAHGPELVATAVCDANGAVVINYTATSWVIGFGGGNSRIDIKLNGVVVASGAFSAPDYSFSGSLPAPDGEDAHLAALAVNNWDDGYEGGQVIHITVPLTVEGCAQAGTGRFTGGGSQIRIDGVRVTRGLTVHCDLLLSNNLEVNWGGNQFHMTEHLETVACTDDPDIIQFPPAAPLDTMIGVGTGRYNGADGYTIEFTFQDYGEPGSEDKARLLIYQTSNPGNIVLNVPLQLLSGGNLQAHYDQPHK